MKLAPFTDRFSLEGPVGILEALLERPRGEWPGLPLHLAGFSFGGAVAVRAAGLRPTHTLVTIAPAVHRIPSMDARPDSEWLIIQGDGDDVVSPDAVRSWARTFVPPPELVLIAGAGHFFHGRLVELREAVEAFFGRSE